jgi:hypothetical protein
MIWFVLDCESRVLPSIFELFRRSVPAFFKRIISEKHLREKRTSPPVALWIRLHITVRYPHVVAWFAVVASFVSNAFPVEMWLLTLLATCLHLFEFISSAPVSLSQISRRDITVRK